MKTLLLSYLFVAVGGALGAAARFTLNLTFQRDSSLPLGTLAANLLGCLLMGAIAYLVATSDWFNNAGVIPDQYRLLFAVGFCGSFTTLSTVVLEMNTLAGRGDWLTAGSYLVVSVAGGLLAFWLGYTALRTLA
ncbi:MAG: fluoride efflux transporter CrcB [Pseudomonadota bacterium]